MYASVGAQSIRVSRAQRKYTSSFAPTKNFGGAEKISKFCTKFLHGASGIRATKLRRAGIDVENFHEILDGAGRGISTDEFFDQIAREKCEIFGDRGDVLWALTKCD